MRTGSDRIAGEGQPGRRIDDLNRLARGRRPSSRSRPGARGPSASIEDCVVALCIRRALIADEEVQPVAQARHFHRPLKAAEELRVGVRRALGVGAAERVRTCIPRRVSQLQARRSRCRAIAGSAGSCRTPAPARTACRAVVHAAVDQQARPRRRCRSDRRAVRRRFRQPAAGGGVAT